MSKHTPKRHIPPRELNPLNGTPDSCYLIYSSRVEIPNKDNFGRRCIGYADDRESCLDSLDRAISFAKAKALCLSPESEALICVYLDIDEYSVFNYGESGDSSPVGFCRKPSMKGSFIYYQLPMSNVSHSGKTKTISKPIVRLYRELFGEELVIKSKKVFFQQLQKQAEASNEALREKLAALPRLAATPEVRRTPTAQHKYRLGSNFDATKDMDDYAAAVGGKVSGKEGATMSSYCPLL